MSVLTSIARYLLKPNPIKNSFVVVGCAVLPRRLYSVDLALLFFNLQRTRNKVKTINIKPVSEVILSKN